MILFPALTIPFMRVMENLLHPRFAKAADLNVDHYTAPRHDIGISLPSHFNAVPGSPVYLPAKYD